MGINIWISVKWTVYPYGAEMHRPERERESMNILEDVDFLLTIEGYARLLGRESARRSENALKVNGHLSFNLRTL